MYEVKLLLLVGGYYAEMSVSIKDVGQMGILGGRFNQMTALVRCLSFPFPRVNCNAQPFPLMECHWVIIWQGIDLTFIIMLRHLSKTIRLHCH